MNKTIVTLLLLISAIFTVATPAAAIETAELENAREAHRYAQALAAQEEPLSEPYRIDAPFYATTSEFTLQVERWRPVVQMYFPEDRVDWALRIIECESHGDPAAKNPRSTASGLFQHLASLWPERSAAAGFAGADVFDPFANIGAAAWLLETGGTGHWVCKASR